MRRAVREQVRDMIGRCRRANRHHGPDRIQPGRRGEHRRAAETVTDQNGRRSEFPLQRPGRMQQIVDVRGKITVREIPVAVAQPGKIEAQHRDSSRRQRATDTGSGSDILAAGKAVRE